MRTICPLYWGSMLELTRGVGFSIMELCGAVRCGAAQGWDVVEWQKAKLGCDCDCDCAVRASEGQSNTFYAKTRPFPRRVL